MNKKIYFVFLIVLISLIVGVYSFGSRNSVENLEIGEYDDFAQCISGKNIKMYGSITCSWCAKQRELFGSSFDFIDEIECNPYERGNQASKCLDEGIASTPTWILYDGNIQVERLSGYQSLEALSEFSGCELIKDLI